MDINSGFLGSGWSFPPTFGQRGATLQIVSGESDIRESLYILLSTNLRERVLLPDYGCKLDDFLFEEINQALLTNISSVVREAILYYEPRIDVESVEIDESDNFTEGNLIIQVVYRVKTTNSRYNFVYPFYINEASHKI